MRKTNRFQAGPQVSGDSFFGRRNELDRLGEWMFGASPCYGLSIVGPHRIGKSSLVAQVLREHAGQSNVLVIRMNVGEWPNVTAFWYVFVEEMEAALRQKGIWDETLEKAREKLECLVNGDENWYLHMRQPLITMLSKTREHGMRVLWVLDEFDAARWVLDEKCYFQFIRTLSSETDRYNMTTVLISRSPVAEIERSADGISTFHGVFATFTLYGFNDQDMEEFYGALTDYDIFPDDEMRNRLEYYCGRIPFLLSMFAREMVEDQLQRREVDAARVDEIFARRLRGDMEDFYKTLHNRFQEDRQLEAMLGALFGPMTLAEQRNVSVLEQRGYLSRGENGYYAMTRDFTVYLELQQTNVPLFETLIRAERRLKEMIRTEFPVTDQLRYRPDQSRDEAVRQWAAELGPYQSKGLPGQLDFLEQVHKNCRILSNWQENASFLDGITLGAVVRIINAGWDACFSKYFPSENNSDWKGRLEEFHHIRNPIMHACGDCIPNNVLERVLKNCQQICNLQVPG